MSYKQNKETWKRSCQSIVSNAARAGAECGFRTVGNSVICETATNIVIGQWDGVTNQGFIFNREEQILTEATDHPARSEILSKLNRSAQQTTQPKTAPRVPPKRTEYVTEPVVPQQPQSEPANPEIRMSRSDVIPHKDDETTEEQQHIVAVTISDNGANQETRRLKVGGSTEQEATNRATAYYKTAGKRIHDAVYVKPLTDDSNNSTNRQPTKTTPLNQSAMHQVGNTQGWYNPL